MKSGRVVTPYWAAGGAQSWSAVNACQLFMPCDSAILVDNVSGVTIPSTSGINVVYDSATDTVTTDYSPDGALYLTASGGTFNSVAAGKTILFMYSGFLNASTVSTGGGRVTIGGGGYANGASGRFGLAPQHTIVSVYTDDVTGAASESTYNAVDYAGVNETTLINNAVGIGGYFYKFGIYRPDGLLQETSIRDCATGTEFGTYSIATAVDVLPAMPFNPVFKLAGVNVTGVLRLDFDTLPSNYADLAFHQASEWKRGNRVVLKQWDY